MELSAILLVAGEALLAAFIIWGILNERKLMAFERRAAKQIMAALRTQKARRAAKRHRRQNRAAVYRPVIPGKRTAGDRVA